MPREAFLWALGIVTALVGAVVLVMAVLRLRRRRAVFRRRLRLTPVAGVRSRSIRRVVLDDGVPSEAVGAAATAAAKICPTCGSRYAAGYRVCVRDEHDLTALH